MDLLPNDRSLLEAFRRGEESALERVYFEYASALFAFLKQGFLFSSAGKNFAFNGFVTAWQIEDTVQDVFLKAFRDEARLSYDGLRPFKGYLFTIAKNSVMDLYRRERPGRLDIREIETIGEAEFLSAEENVTPDQHATENELRSQVEIFVEGLRIEMRDFFKARFSEQRSLEDVCSRLKITDYRAKQYERKLKENFFNHMQAAGYFGGYKYGNGRVEKLVVTMLINLGGGGG